MRLSTSRVPVAVALLAILVAPGAAHAEGPGLDNSHADSTAKAFRLTFGLRADSPWVAAVRESQPVSGDWGVPLTDSERSEMNRRLAVSQELDELRELLEQTPGYGGFYTDQSNGGEIVISFVAGATTPDSLIEEALPTQATRRVRVVDFSIADLRRIRDRIGAAMVAAEPWTATIVYASARASTNRVEVGLDPWDDTLAAELRSRFGAVVDPVPTERPMPTICVNRSNCPDPALKGGIHITTATPFGTRNCTSGFMGRRSVNPLPNEWFMITAGHCVEGFGLGDWRHNGTFFGKGKSFSYQNAANVDAGIIKMTALDFPSNLVYANSPTDIRGITGVEFDENQNEGDPVCRGASYNNNNYLCGVITLENTPYTADVGIVIMHGWKMDKGTLVGGSGGPVMNGFKAYGIVSASTGGTTWYGSIDWVSATLGYRPCYNGVNNPC